MKELPKRIYLQVGDGIPEDIKFSDLDSGEITWSTHRIFDSDIEYSLLNEKKKCKKCKEKFQKKETKLKHIITSCECHLRITGREMAKMKKAIEDLTKREKDVV